MSFTFEPDTRVTVDFDEVPVVRDSDGTDILRAGGAGGEILLRAADPAAIKVLRVGQEAAFELREALDKILNDPAGDDSDASRVVLKGALAPVAIEVNSNGDYVLTDSFGIVGELGGSGAGFGEDGAGALRVVLNSVINATGDGAGDSA